MIPLLPPDQVSTELRYTHAPGHDPQVWIRLYAQLGATVTAVALSHLHNDAWWLTARDPLSVTLNPRPVRGPQRRTFTLHVELTRVQELGVYGPAASPAALSDTLREALPRSVSSGAALLGVPAPELGDPAPAGDLNLRAIFPGTAQIGSPALLRSAAGHDHFELRGPTRFTSFAAALPVAVAALTAQLSGLGTERCLHHLPGRWAE